MNNVNNSPHQAAPVVSRSSNQFYATTTSSVGVNQTPTLLPSENSSTSNLNQVKLSSTNNLLINQINGATTTDQYDSPTLINANNRLSTGDRRLNNMSNNNLSTSASLLDATTDDAMSSKIK
jgi:hypothetical protein